jgi:transposase
MEIILRLYLLPYDPFKPVVCFDERPCFLIGDTIKGLDMKPGQVAKQNYAYSKHGSCSLLAMIEPLTGKRFVQVRRKRRKKEFALFMKRLASLYPDAVKIVVVLDNLNTHDFSAFYETFDAQTAAELVDRFEFIYTPKCASWLNMIEIEFSALSRQCLNRRIASISELSHEVIAYFKERTQKGIKIDWQFSREKAREKLNRRYAAVNSVNQKFK